MRRCVSKNLPQTRRNTCTADARRAHTNLSAHISSLLAAKHTCTYFWLPGGHSLGMQCGGIMWFMQSRSWQNVSPAELKISPNTLRLDYSPICGFAPQRCQMCAHWVQVYQKDCDICILAWYSITLLFISGGVKGVSLLCMIQGVPAGKKPLENLICIIKKYFGKRQRTLKALETASCHPPVLYFF